MKRSIGLLGAVALMLSTAYVSAADTHPLLSGYPEAKLMNSLQWDYEAFDLPDAAPVPGEADLTVMNLVGDRYQYTYEIPHVSSQKVFENYRAALSNGGFTTVFECKLEACGTEEQAAKLGQALSPTEQVYNYYRKPYYLLAEKAGARGPVYVGLYVGAYDDEVRVQQAILESEPLELGLVSLNEAALQNSGTEASVEPLSEAEKAKDNPLLPRYPGATLRTAQRAESESVTLPWQSDDQIQPDLTLQGDVSHHTYEIKHASSQKVFENYRDALEKAQFEFIGECRLDRCIEPQTLGGQMSQSDSVYNYYHKPHYLMAKRTGGEGDLYVGIYVGAYLDESWVEQITVQENEIETGLVTITDDEIQEQIDQTGKALIYGIYFDTDQATIQPESKPALDAIATLLGRNTTLNLYVVGHTDDTGAQAHNLDLSIARANAVVDTLVDDYGINRTRLDPQGVGPFAPAATNTDEGGKQKNRRVELVERLR
jgi:outer membrane protein OmpA-like peptidoglycan-associated protein